MAKFIPCPTPVTKTRFQIFRLSRNRFGCFFSMQSDRPTKVRRQVFLCDGSPKVPVGDADRATFRGLAKAWKLGTGFAVFNNPPTPPPPNISVPPFGVTINKAAWKTFAAANPYFRSPTNSRILTGYQLFIAWNQASLSATLFRLQGSLLFPPGYPYVNWPSPPPAYNPLFITDFTPDLAIFPRNMTLNPIPDHGNQDWTAILSSSGPPNSSQLETRHPPIFFSATDWDGTIGPPVALGRDDLFWSHWHCFRPGYVTFYLSLVDFTTGSPGPPVKKVVFIPTF